MLVERENEQIQTDSKTLSRESSVLLILCCSDP